MDLLSFPIKAALFGVVMLFCWLAPTATYAWQDMPPAFAIRP